jgi:hypothetical protein
VTQSFLGRDTADVATGTLWLDGGAIAILQNTWHLAASCPYGFTFETTVHAAGTTYSVRNEPDVHVWGADGVAAPELHFWPRIGGARRGALVDELAHFAACARRGVDSPVIPLDDAVHVIAVAEALQRSARDGGIVRVEP